MPRIVLLIIGLAMIVAAALAATRTGASVPFASHGLRGAGGNTGAIEEAPRSARTGGIRRPGQGCA